MSNDLRAQSDDGMYCARATRSMSAVHIFDHDGNVCRCGGIRGFSAELATLRGENERLRAGLERIATLTSGTPYGKDLRIAVETARAALTDPSEPGAPWYCDYCKHEVPRGHVHDYTALAVLSEQAES